MNMVNTASMSRRNKQEDEKKRNRKWIILVILLLAAAALGFVVYRMGNPTGNAAYMVAGDIFPGAGGAAGGHLPDMTNEQVMDQMQKEADETMFSFKINAQPVFEDGGSAGTLRIENPSHNLYPFVVEIVLDETGEKIYDSGGVLPDHHIDVATLSTVLEKGAHEATAYINAYDPETNELQGKSAVSLSLIIKN